MSSEEQRHIFSCDDCRILDCKRPWRVKFCWACEGNNHRCEVCYGSGQVEIKDCPRSLASIGYTALLPYFYSWYYGEGRQWPDGKSMIDQPLKLRKAFSLLCKYMNSNQKKEQPDGK